METKKEDNVTENIAILRAGLTAEGDMSGDTPVALLRGVDDLGQPVFLRLDADQMKAAANILDMEAESWALLAADG